MLRDLYFVFSQCTVHVRTSPLNKLHTSANENRRTRIPSSIVYCTSTEFCMLFSDLGQIGSSAMNVSYYNSVIAAVCRHLMLQLLDYNNIASCNRPGGFTLLHQVRYFLARIYLHRRFVILDNNKHQNLHLLLNYFQNFSKLEGVCFISSNTHCCGISASNDSVLY